MRRTPRALVVTALAVIGGVLAVPIPAWAEAPADERSRPATERPTTERPPTERPPTERPPTERPPTERPPTGYDVSHPQCGADLPEGQAFGIVGVNGGIATRVNPCLVEQLAWAAGSTGGARGQPPVQVYVNTANPGQVRDRVTTWPSATDSPYGTCDGGNTMACSWVYGRIRAQVTVHAFFQPAARGAGIDDDPAAHRWWLDVETMNTWQSGSPAALERNRAALEGMAGYLEESGAEVGVYSTGYQWRRIVGEVPPGSVLHDLDSWLAGAGSRAGAVDNCGEPPLTGGGRVVLAQWVDDGLDHDVSCGRDRPRG